MALTTPQLREVSRKTWETLQTIGSKHKNTTWCERDGQTIKLETRLGAIVGMSARGLFGKQPVDDETYLVIAHLRQFGNAAIIRGGSKPVVFVASQYQTDVAIEERQQTRYRAAHAEVSEHKEEPVTTTDLWDEFNRMPIGDKQAETLKQIHLHGGRIHDESGFVSNDYGLDTHALGELRSRDLIKTRQANERRHAEIKLTTKGRWAVEHLSWIQFARIRVATFLVQRGGSFTGSSPKYTLGEFASETHLTRGSASRALVQLEDMGLVKREWSPGGGAVASVRWIGKELPGVHLDNGKHEEPVVEVTEVDELPEPEVQWDDDKIEGATEEERRDIVEEHIQALAEMKDSRVSSVSPELAAIFLRLAEFERNATFEEDSRISDIRALVKQFTNGEISALKALTSIDDLVSETPRDLVSE